jgi:tRNA/rRNA methyltransferase
MTSIILVEPQMGENIGATARAMKNFGINDLRVVNPRDGWPNHKAIEMSVGAVDVVESAKIYQNLNSSLSGVSKLYALTARRRDMNKPHLYLHEITEIPANSAFMFGRESSGLSNNEISMADCIVSIDTDPHFTSLNIAQSVILVCYQIFKSRSSDEIVEDLCDKEHLVYFLDSLISMLDKRNFFKVEEKRATMLCNIRNIFTRNNLSPNELQTLIGIIKKLDC